MDDKNILQGGMKELEELGNDLSRRDELENALSSVTAEEKETGERLEAYEKDVENEIESTVKKREKEVVESFDRDINEESKKLKRVNNNRGKAKKKGQKERIKEETKNNTDEITRLNREIDSEFRAVGVPAICNSTFYYAMYFTKTWMDWIIFIVTSLMCLAIIPGLVDMLASWHWIVKTIVHILIVVIFIVVYITVWLCTKDRYNQVIGDMRDKRDDIAENKKIIRAIKKRIKEDKNEEMYNLNDYDTEIVEIRKRIDDISDRRKAAVEEFENVMKPALIKDIENKYEGDIKEHKKKIAELSEKRRNLEDEQKELGAKITSSYKAYISEEYLDATVVEEMKHVMQEENISTISEVVKYMEDQYKTIY